MTKFSFYMPASFLAMLMMLGAVAPDTCKASPVTITVTADNHYDLFVNGVLIGSQNNSDGRYGWDAPETWVVDMNPGLGVIAFVAQDESAASGSGIGLIAKIVVEGGDTYVTDHSWKVSEVGPAGWEGSGYDDSAWSAPLDEGPFDSIPWSIFASPIAAFASSGARWLWRGSPAFASGYGYYNAGGYQFCFFRKVVSIPAVSPVRAVSWSSLKARYH